MIRCFGDDGRPINQILEEVPPTITRVHAPVYPHTDWDTRYEYPKTWGKVAFRPNPDIQLHWGSHRVEHDRGDAIHGILAIRELQYRDFDHFLAKIAKAKALFESWDVPWEHGSHMRALVNLDPELRYAAYQEYLAPATVRDPIPYKGL